MPTQESIRQIDCVINGHRVSGWSDDDPPYEFPDIDLINTKYGQDGSLYASDTGMQGGEFTVKLLPTSRTAAQILRWMGQRQRGARLTFSGSLTDSQLGYSVLMKGGFLKRCPPGTSVNKTFEAVFEFEQYIPDYDGADFSAPPPSS